MIFDAVLNLWGAGFVGAHTRVCPCALASVCIQTATMRLLVFLCDWVNPQTVGIKNTITYAVWARVSIRELTANLKKKRF